MTEWLSVGGMLAAMFLLVPIAILTASVYLLPRASLEVLPDPESEAQRQAGEAVLGAEWLEEQGFVWEGAYRQRSFLGTTTIRAWRQPHSATFLCQYALPGNNTALDIVSIFSTTRHVGLTTGSSAGAQFLPHKPGIYVQSFSGVDTGTLWQRHLESEVVVADATGISPEPVDEPFEALLRLAISEQMKYIRSLPLWPLRAPYWFYIKRHRLHNKPVSEIIERGWTRAEAPPAVLQERE
ncbi:MAG: hypothetical protein ACODAQ_07205 [Phycisphaeraceae bacterium]